MTTPKTAGSLIEAAMKEAESARTDPVEEFIERSNLGKTLADLRDSRLTVEEALAGVVRTAPVDDSELNELKAVLASVREELNEIYEADYDDDQIAGNIKELVDHYKKTSKEDDDPAGTPQTSWRSKLKKAWTEG